jgi:ABC-2 type transport system ATP-binding protein
VASLGGLAGARTAPLHVVPGGEGSAAGIASIAETAVECRGLTKRFQHLLALDALDLSIPEGSIFGFLGPNGAGKTTTLRLLTGLARPTSGSAVVAGVRVDSGRGTLANRIGYLDQSPRFYGWMTGRELLEFVGRLSGMRGNALAARIDEVLDLVGLADSGGRRVAGYSGGMRQRLGLGQAILARPRVLFLDEPVSALDPEGRKDVLEIIGRLRGSATVVMSTHILNDVERVCDRVGILDHGRLLAESPIDDLLNAYARPLFRLEPEAGQGAGVGQFVETLRGCSWVRDVRRDEDSITVLVHDASDAAPRILPLMAASGLVFEGYERVRPTLEDVFLQIVGEEPAAGVTATGGTPADATEAAP